MNKIVRFFLMVTLSFLAIYTSLYAQNVGINITGAAPHTSAMLDILSSDKGFLIPRVALNGTGDVATITSPTTSLMVYNTATAGSVPTNVLPGFYYWDGSKWVAFGGTGGRDWSLLGNAGTVDGTHFLGTTDNVALNFRVNNNKAGRIDPAGPTFFGYESGNSNLTGSSVTGIGSRALYSNLTGEANVAIGDQSLFSNFVGSFNVAIGSSALYDGTLASANTAIGFRAIRSNFNGNFNTATGSEAMSSNTVGINNTATGRGALFSNRIGNNNVVTGSSALYGTAGSNNSTIDGSYAAFCFSSSGPISNATIFGFRAGAGLTTGSNNIFLGYQAGNNVTTGAKNIVIGYDIDSPTNTGSNRMTIGNLIFATGVVGTGTTVSTGSVSIGKNVPAYKLDVVGDINSSTNVRAAGVILTSDARLKKNIVNLSEVAETIMKLHPVTYQKKESIDATAYTKNEIGFIAQEVQKILPQLVYEGKDSNKILALDYNSLIPLLTKAIQEQQAQIEQLKKGNLVLKKLHEEVLNGLQNTK